MINDYAGYCAAAGVNKSRHLAGRATARNSLAVPASGLAGKLAGLLVAFSLLLGLSSTLWYSGRIDQALGTIGETRAAMRVLTAEQEELAVRRSSLADPEHIRSAAAKLGLFPPENRQIRTP